MSEITAEPEVAEVGDDAVAARRPSKRRIFQLPDGARVPVSEFQSTAKIDRDVLIHYLGERQVVVPGIGKKKPKVEWVTEYDPASALRDKPLEPGFDSPLCKQCALHEHGCRTPFMPYQGADQPLITIIFDGVSRAEDMQGRLGNGGSAERIRRIIDDNSAETGVTSADIRWVPMTRCASWSKKQLDLKSRGNWCRYHVIDDLMLHTPALIIPIGTKALGLLSHKSNAQEWSGRLLTYRGWPDDWLMNAKYMLPRVLHQPPTPKGKPPVVLPPDHSGHPLFGQAPDWRIPMVPLQSPRLIDMAQSDYVYKRWERQLLNALKQAKQGVKVLSYTREWYRFTADIELIEDALNYLLQHPGLKVCYDTETTGLRPWAADAAIVSVMLRWSDPATGAPRSIGFPWQYTNSPEHQDYEVSPLLKYIPRLKPLVWKVLTRATLVGHNLTFDMLYTYATFWRKHLVGWADRSLNLQRDRVMVSLANACRFDTWHMAFALRQARGSLGLEALAYQWVPEFAGYEEEMTLLIGLHYDAMHPGAGAGGHYLNCAKAYWPNHVTPYVMGDVEVCYRAQEKLAVKLETSNVYAFPLAHPTKRGRFRDFVPQDRKFIYDKIMSPAAGVLMKMMARGMFIDTKKLLDMEDRMPKQIMKLREDLKGVDPRILTWCETNERTVSKEDAAKIAKGEPVKKWELDLEDKGQLKDLLFKVLKLPVTRFTKSGKKELGEDIKKAHDMLARVIVDMKPELGDDPAKLEEAVQEELRKVAAIDKFTLNKICCQFENLRPLQKYRKAFKLYSTYVRPLRNIFTTGLDKKARTADAHLCFDQCVHAQFLLTGTRGGRLCVAGDTLLCIRIGSEEGEEVCVEIKDIVKFLHLKLYVMTGRQRWKRIKTLYYKGYEEMFQLSTSGGSTIKGTAGHRLKTDAGWESIGDLRVGRTVYVDLRSRNRAVVDRGLLCALGTDSEMGFQHVGERNNQKDYAAEPHVLQGEVQDAAGEVNVGATGSNNLRQCAGQSSAVRNSARGGLFKESVRGFWNVAAGSSFWNIGVYCKTKFKVLRAAFAEKAGKKQSRHDAKSRHGAVRQAVPRTEHDACCVGAGAHAFFGKSLLYVFDVFAGCVALKGHVQNAFQVYQGKNEVGYGGGVVVGSTARGRVSARAAERENTFLARTSNSKLRKEAGRFCAHQQQYPAGSGWRVPRGEERQLTGLGIAGARIPSVAILNAVSDPGNADCDGEDQGRVSEAIAAICPIDLQEVWDIEVEDDHSYTAQGLIHHNSSRNPNLQQLPRDGEVKSMFTSRFGDRGCIYQSDLSQIELRLLAAACGDSMMCKAYEDDIDLHSLTTSYIFKVPYEHFEKSHMKKLQEDGKSKEAKELEEKRSIGKTCNFLTGYGGGAYGLQNVLAGKDIYRSPEECQGIIDLFFDTYPALREWLQQYKRFILDTQCAVSLFGRVRVFEEVLGNDEEAKAKALRAGCNHVIQSTASDMMLVALFCIENMMRDEGLESILVSTVHDSLLIDCVREELPQVHSIVMSVLNNFPAVFKAVFGDDYDTSWLSIPFAGDSEAGVSYLSLSKLPSKDVNWDEVYERLLAT